MVSRLLMYYSLALCHAGLTLSMQVTTILYFMGFLTPAQFFLHTQAEIVLTRCILEFALIQSIKHSEHRDRPLDSIKYLGMYLDSTLNGKAHCGMLS